MHIIEIEPDFAGMASEVRIRFITKEERFKLTIKASSRCIAGDLYNVAAELAKIVDPVSLKAEARHGLV